MSARQSGSERRSRAIAYLSLGSELGGAERSLLDLLASMRASYPEASAILVAGGDGPLTLAARDLGAQVRIVPVPSSIATIGDSVLDYRGRVIATLALGVRALPAALAARRYAARLGEAIRSIEPGLIHSNDNKSHLLATMAGAGSIPVVWHLRDFISSRRIIGRALRRASGKATGAVAISRAVAEDARRLTDRFPIAVVHNGVDLDHFSPGDADPSALPALDRDSAPDAGAVRVGLVATYGRWKGQDVFLDAVARVLKHAPDLPVTFYLVGGPIYRTGGSQFSEEELRDRAAALGVAKRIVFVPFRSDPAPAYRAMDVVVHASTRPEPFGRTIVEAMGCGRAVILARAGGAAEILTEGVDAIGVPPGDPSALAGAIEMLVRDPSRRRDLGRHARATALDRFSRARLATDVVAAYEAFLSAAGRPGLGLGAAVPSGSINRA